MNNSPNIALGVDTTIQSSDRLGFTIFIAIIMHAMLIFGLSFAVPERSQSAPSLEITLARHASINAPEDADFLAQHNQEASGTEQIKKELTTESIADFAAPDVREINPTPQVQASKAQSMQQLKIVTTTAESIRQTPQKRENDIAADTDIERNGAQEEHPTVTPEIASLQAKIDRQRQEYAKRPRIRRLTSVATKAAVDAEYLLQWDSKIEAIGNSNFPQEALQQHITGNLLMSVTLNPDGTIRNLELSESSGYNILDKAALQIVRLAAPFDPFPPEIRETTDQLIIIRTWAFEIDGLTTHE